MATLINRKTSSFEAATGLEKRACNNGLCNTRFAHRFSCTSLLHIALAEAVGPVSNARLDCSGNADQRDRCSAPVHQMGWGWTFRQDVLVSRVLPHRPAARGSGQAARKGWQTARRASVRRASDRHARACGHAPAHAARQLVQGVHSARHREGRSRLPLSVARSQQAPLSSSISSS